MFDESRLERLTSAHFDQALSADERAELEAMLLSSSKARQFFLDQAELHGLLREQALQAGGITMMEKSTSGVGRGKWISRGAWTAGLAACIALGWWLSPFRGGTDQQVADTAGPSMEDVALLGLSIGAEWEGPSFSPGAAMPKGMVNIRKGTLRLDFYSGARVILEGPAKLELISPSLARLDEGKLVARVPPPAQGFTILNGNLRVVDRGTQFGMSADGKDCSVHVFDGEVELQGELPESTARNLFEGEAVAIREGKTMNITADRQSFADTTQMLQAAARETEVKWENWREQSRRFSKIPGLLVYFDFEDFDPAGLTLQNRASGAGEHSHGTVIGCEKLSGRWSRKGSLGFAKDSDRVCFLTTGSSESITLMAWVRVDSLPLDHNMLLSMSPGEAGEIHWKLDRTGRLLFGLRAAPEFGYNSWERLESPQVITPGDFGRWLHLATVVDRGQNQIRHYVNGSLVASGPLQRRVPVKLGLANLGNLQAPYVPDGGTVRNFNGRIDEFALFDRALSPEEIAATE